MSRPPEYALLAQLRSPTERSQFGTSVDLDRSYPDLIAEPLVINRHTTNSHNPNRYKQHGFHFNADNCIACHACESACPEKNNLPPHLAFRKVGYLEAGAWPDFLRVNISMACNHCENPVCLKGCPTRAYTKYAEYGAVLQDPDICFGCGYCTWVCPYNAPQLDPVKGQVEKCNMCIDRLEQGLKPACVAACLGNALEFGVIEDKPAGRDQTRIAIPGFPTPEISRPNIRFQQIRSLPPGLTRVDAQPLHYQRTPGAGRDAHRPLPQAENAAPAWNLRALSSRENPLVLFTLLSQFVVGAFLLLFLGPRLALAAHALAQSQPLTQALLLPVLVALQALALAAATSHIGKPLRFYRGFNNLRHSWVSREAAALMLFFACLTGYATLTVLPGWFAWLPSWSASLLGWAAAIAGPVALYSIRASIASRRDPTGITGTRARRSPRAL